MEFEKQSIEEDMKKRLLNSSVFSSEKQSSNLFWVHKNIEVFKEDFNNLWIISRLFVFDNWKEIKQTLEEWFNSKLIINPLFAENALIKLDQGSIEDFIEKPEKWQELGPFHLKFERRNKFIHSRPKSIKGFGGWLRIKNLPLDYWCKLRGIFVVLCLPQ